MAKLIIDVECDGKLEDYDVVCYFNGKWKALNREILLAQEAKKRQILERKIEELDNELKTANKKIIKLAEIIKGE